MCPARSDSDPLDQVVARLGKIVQRGLRIAAGGEDYCLAGRKRAAARAFALAQSQYRTVLEILLVSDDLTEAQREHTRAELRGFGEVLGKLYMTIHDCRTAAVPRMPAESTPRRGSDSSALCPETLYAEMQAAGQRLIDAVKLEEEFSTLEAQDTEGALSQWQEARALVDMAERDYDAAVKRCNRVHVHCPMCPTVSLLQKTVLVLESEERESCYLRDSLEDRGSTVLVASNSAEAFDVWERCGREINLVVAEVTLTGGICGLEVAQQLSQKCPNIAALLISSYAKESLAKRGLLDPAMRLFRRMDFLQKPFSPWALEAKALVLVRR